MLNIVILQQQSLKHMLYFKCVLVILISKVLSFAAVITA